MPSLQDQQPNPAPLKKNSIICVLLSLFCCLLLVVCFQKYTNIPYETLLKKIIRALYLPHFNQAKTGNIANLNILNLIYFSIYSCLLVSFVFLKFNFFRRSNIPRNTLSTTINTNLIIIFLLLIGLQHVSRQTYTHAEIQRYYLNKYSFEIDDFARKINATLKGSHQGEFLANMDLNKDPYITQQRLLSYALYPKIKLRLNNNTPKDVFVLISTNNSETLIPQGYHIAVQSLYGRFQLAVKNEPDHT